MLDLYREINNKLHLSFGNTLLSPLTALSVALVYEHIENFATAGRPQAMFMSFPIKEKITALLPGIVLINLFFEDYVYRSCQIEQDLALKRGDVIEIFHTAAIFNKMNADTLELSFSEGGQYNFNRRYINFIQKTAKKRPNTHKLFNENKLRFLSNPDALSRILESSGKLPVPKASLKSKVMIVSGRGNMGKIRRSLSDLRIFEEPLGNIVLEDTNLIIKQDLEEFIGLASGQGEIAEQKFCTLFSLVVSRFQPHELEECQGLGEIRQSIGAGETTHPDFRELFERFLDDMDPGSELFSSFLPLVRHLPVAAAGLPSGLKAIFVCDLKLYERYEHTIDYFIKKGTPVICLVDKLMETKEELEFFSQFFASRPETVRLNWSREVMSQLKVNDEDVQYLDDSFWSFAKRYAQQRIGLKVYDDKGLEVIIEKASAVIRSLEGHEILIESFRKWLLPAWYIVKNSFGANLPPLSLLDAFDQAISGNIHTVPQEVLVLSSALRNFTFNQKQPGCSQVYIQQVMVREKGLFRIPSGTAISGVPAEAGSEEIICFPGFPYLETAQRPLWRAVFETLVPQIHIALWPKEAQLTDGYLRSRILKSEMPVNLDPVSRLQKLVFSAGDNALVPVNRIFSTLQGTGAAPVPADFPAYKPDTEDSHSGYTGSTSQQGYQIPCNILYFESEMMYLPHQSSLHRLLDDGYGKLSLKTDPFAELSRGDRILLFNLTRHDLRIYAKSDPKHLDDFELVDKWRELLLHAFWENGSELPKFLAMMEEMSSGHGGKGSPTRYNLLRWLFDEDMIAPAQENLSLIFLCAGKKGEGLPTEPIVDAANRLRRASKRISGQIRKAALQSINSHGKIPDGFIMAQGISVRVVLREIRGIEKSDVMVNYADTRKLLK